MAYKTPQQIGSTDQSQFLESPWSLSAFSLSCALCSLISTGTWAALRRLSIEMATGCSTASGARERRAARPRLTVCDCQLLRIRSRQLLVNYIKTSANSGWTTVYSRRVRIGGPMILYNPIYCSLPCRLWHQWRSYFSIELPGPFCWPDSNLLLSFTFDIYLFVIIPHSTD